jgi:tRNA threonylcarbamoyladenosine biosynthesis protein TsaB
MACRVKILAFDTSSSVISIALQCDEEQVFFHQVAPLQHTQLILPNIKSLLDSCDLSLNQLDAIAYACGPGSFTGIRIASSIAQGFGLATSLPIIPISSLAVLAQTAYLEQQWTNLLIALDARMDQIYWAVYQTNANGIVELLGEEQVLFPDQTSINNNQLDWFGVGDGWDKYQTALSKHNVQKMANAQQPHARALLSLAKIKLKNGDWVASRDAVPIYLR